MMTAFILMVSFMIMGTHVSACGFTTHNVVAERAANYYFHTNYDGYKDIANHYRDAVLGGAPFPDYLYTCGSDHDAGEDAHWNPFSAAAATYIRARPKPFDEPTQKLIAFFLGVQSHYIADVNWHGLVQVPHSYGFIQTLGEQDFNCTGDLCSVAHSAADTGAEFSASWATDLTFFEPLQWYVPSADLVKIYGMIGRKVNASAIDECHAIFAAGALAIKYISFFIYAEETNKAPFMTEQYIDHPLGGVDDMAIWTGRMWDRFAQWVEEGPPSPLPPSRKQGEPSSYSAASIKLIRSLAPLFLNDSFIQHHSNSDTTTSFTRASDEALRAHLKYMLLHSDLPAAHQARRLIGARSIDDARTIINQAKHDDDDRDAQSVNDGVQSVAAPPQELMSFESTNPLEYAGYSVQRLDWNGDGIDDIAMGGFGHTPSTHLPQTGAVYIQFGSKSSLSSDVTERVHVPLPSSVIVTNLAYARFGWALTTLDFNLDGIDDLVVSAPTAGWDWAKTSSEPVFLYYGTVFIYFGSKTGQLPSQPDVTINSRTANTNLGHILSYGDVNGDGKPDLLIGAPYARATTDGMQRGLVRIFYSLASRRSGTILAEEDANNSLLGPSDFGWFGHSIAVINVAHQDPLLIIGAPGYRVTTAGPTVGRLYGYSIINGVLQTNATYFSITSYAQQAKFGFRVAVGTPLSSLATPLLAVSAPSWDTKVLTARAGQVMLINLQGIRGDVSLANVKPVTTLQGTSYGQRFGWSLHFTDLTNDGFDDLLIGSPLLTSFYNQSDHEGGLTSIFIGGAKFPTGQSVDTKADWNVGGVQRFGRFGWSITAADVNGDGHKEIVIGEPRAAGRNTMTTVDTVHGDITWTGAEMAGAVRVYASPH